MGTYELPLALLSRRQYLSRMDRFQHGRSARTLEPQLFEINEKSVLASFFGLSWQTCRIQTDRYDAGMFLDRGDTGPFIALHLRAAESYQCFGKQRQPGDRHRNCSIAL
jgi:hypothetical protein